MLFREFLVRPATNQDIPSIKKVVFSCLKEHGLNPAIAGKDSDLNDIEENYLSKNGYFGVAVNVITNIIVGTFGLFPVNEDTCELRKMYLLKEVRGKGLGKFILSAAIEIAQEKRYKKIILETISPLTVAISLYKKYGFKEIKPREINERVDQAFELTIYSEGGRGHDE
jgi:putative acetyltransferase